MNYYYYEITSPIDNSIIYKGLVFAKSFDQALYRVHRKYLSEIDEKNLQLEVENTIGLEQKSKLDLLREELCK